MKVLGLLGSPRRNGNTYALLNKALEGAKSAGAETNMIFVNDLNIKGCQGCNAHFKTEKCILKDDMNQIYEKILDSDIIIFASPNYLGQITGQLKIVYDRLYAYNGEDDKILSYKPKDKKVGLIMAQRQPDASIYLNYIKIIMFYLNLYFAGGSKFFIAPGVKNIGEATQNPELLKSAYNMGVELVKS